MILNGFLFAFGIALFILLAWAFARLNRAFGSKVWPALSAPFMMFWWVSGRPSKQGIIFLVTVIPLAALASFIPKPTNEYFGILLVIAIVPHLLYSLFRWLRFLFREVL